MQAYQNKPQLKKNLLAEVVKHRKQDQIIQGTYGKENGIWKGCAVGCSIHSLNIKLGKEYSTSDHSIYETELGIPKELAYLEDALFEEMSVKDSKTWPEKFLEAINPGADLSKIVVQFVIWEFEDHEKGLKNIKEVQEDKEVYGFCEEVVALYKRDLAGDKPSEDEYYKLYVKINEAWARAWARTWAGAWAWARTWAGARAWAGARTWAGAGAGARTWAGAGAGAGAREKYQEEVMVSANKILELLRGAKE